MARPLEHEVGAHEGMSLERLDREIGSAIAVDVPGKVRVAARLIRLQLARDLVESLRVDELESLVSGCPGAGIDARQVDCVGAMDEVADGVAVGFRCRIEHEGIAAGMAPEHVPSAVA